MTECKYDVFNLWISRSSWRTRWSVSMLYLWCWQISQAAIASHCWWKESLLQEEQMGGICLQNHSKCDTCLKYFVLLFFLSNVSPALIDLHSTRQSQGQYKPWVSDLTYSRTELICEMTEGSVISTPNPHCRCRQAVAAACPFSLALGLKNGHAQCLTWMSTSFGYSKMERGAGCSQGLCFHFVD